MSIMKASASITRFTVSGIPEVDGKDPIEAMMDSLNRCKIVEMEMGEDIVWGWTKLVDPYFPKFEDVSFFTGDYVTIGLRIDKKSVPSAVIKKEVYIAERKKREELQVPKLARAVRVMIKEAVIKNLLAKAPAVPTTIDIVWNVQEQTMMLFSTNKLARDVLEDIMQESFGLTIEMVFPFTMSLNSIEEGIVSRIQPTSFV